MPLAAQPTRSRVDAFLHTYGGGPPTDEADPSEEVRRSRIKIPDISIVSCIGVDGSRLQQSHHSKLVRFLKKRKPPQLLQNLFTSNPISKRFLGGIEPMPPSIKPLILFWCLYFLLPLAFMHGVSEACFFLVLRFKSGRVVFFYTHT